MEDLKMSFNIGRQKKITELFEDNGFKFTDKEHVKDKKIIIQKFEKRTDENGQNYAVIGGQIYNDDQTAGEKEAFYIPNFDESGILNCTDEDITELVWGGYYYMVQEKISDNGRNYYIGFLEVLP